MLIEHDSDSARGPLGRRDARDVDLRRNRGMQRGLEALYRRRAVHVPMRGVWAGASYERD